MGKKTLGAKEIKNALNDFGYASSVEDVNEFFNTAFASFCKKSKIDFLDALEKEIAADFSKAKKDPEFKKFCSLTEQFNEKNMAVVQSFGEDCAYLTAATLNILKASKELGREPHPFFATYAKKLAALSDENYDSPIEQVKVFFSTIKETDFGGKNNGAPKPANPFKNLKL